MGSCCGARVIVGFPHRFDLEKIVKGKKYLKNLFKREDKINKTYTIPSSVGLLYTANLTEAQQSVWGDILISHGFRMVESWKNRNTFNNLYLYVKTTNPIKSEIKS
jgi:hypothetical protein